MKFYFWNIVQALNRLMNTIWGGTDKEYLSSRIFRYRNQNRVAGVLYKILNSIETDHCEKAYSDAQIPFDPEDAVWK